MAGNKKNKRKGWSGGFNKLKKNLLQKKKGFGGWLGKKPPPKNASRRAGLSTLTKNSKKLEDKTLILREKQEEQRRVIAGAERKINNCLNNITTNLGNLGNALIDGAVEGLDDMLQGKPSIKKAFKIGKNILNFNENEFQKLARHAKENMQKGDPVEMLDDLVKDMVPIINKGINLIDMVDKECLGLLSKTAKKEMQACLKDVAKATSKFIDTCKKAGVGNAVLGLFQKFLNSVKRAAGLEIKAKTRRRNTN